MSFIGEKLAPEIVKVPLYFPVSVFWGTHIFTHIGCVERACTSLILTMSNGSATREESHSALLGRWLHPLLRSLFNSSVMTYLTKLVVMKFFGIMLLPFVNSDTEICTSFNSLALHRTARALTLSPFHALVFHEVLLTSVGIFSLEYRMSVDPHLSCGSVTCLSQELLLS